MEFDWYRNGDQNVLYWHWSPNYGWEMNFPLEGYNECLITYILAASSPTHSSSWHIDRSSYAGRGRCKSSVPRIRDRLSLLRHYASVRAGNRKVWKRF